MATAEQTAAGGAATPAPSEAAMRAMFNEFDTDRSGAIDRGELQDLVFALGRVLSDDEITESFDKLDTDGSGEIEFDEFKAWFLAPDSTPASGDKATASALTRLKFRLRTRMLTRRAKELHAAVAAQTATPTLAEGGVNRLHWRVAAGKGIPAVDPPLGLLATLTHSAPGALGELGALPSTDKSVAFATFALDPATSTADAAGLVGELNRRTEAFAGELLEEVAPGVRALAWEGPLTTGAEGGPTSRVIMLKAFARKDPVTTVCRALTGGGAAGDAAANRTAQVLKYAGVTLSANQDLSTLLGASPATDEFSAAELAAFADGSAFVPGTGEGPATAGGEGTPPLSLAGEVCVDLDRHALLTAAGAAGALLATKTAALAEVEEGGGEVDPPAAEGLHGALAGIVTALRFLVAAREETLSLEAPSVAELLTLLNGLPAEEEAGEGWQGLPAMAYYALGSTPARMSLATSLGVALGGGYPDEAPVFGPNGPWESGGGGGTAGMGALLSRFLASVTSLDRAGVQTREVLVACDLRGLVLRDLLAPARVRLGLDPGLDEEPNAGTLLVFGMPRAGCTRLCSTLVGAQFHATSPLAATAGYGEGEGQVLTAGWDWSLADVVGSGDEPMPLPQRVASAAGDADWLGGGVFLVNAREGEALLEDAGQVLRTALACAKEAAGGAIPLIVAVNKADTLGPKVALAAVEEALALPALVQEGLITHFTTAYTSAATGRGMTTAMNWMDAHARKRQE